MGCHSFGDSEKQNGLVLENSNAWVFVASSFAELSTSAIDMGEVHYKVCLWPFANALLVLSGRLHSISQIEIVD
ncbi:unnamed protein product [Sphagnum troendelagicum]|uniref:Uncharacterized protein n=1 Tax=Sphagnum troendelagicum TaxID=128251 RepID=A0ABP0TSB0_9BRYO